MASYAEVETALARMHGADPAAQRGAFRGRLKHLQRLGLPLGEKVGKGRRIDYTEEQIWQYALALELAQCGIDPATVARMIKDYWSRGLQENLSQVAHFWGKADDTVMMLAVGFMSLSWEDQDQTLEGIRFMSWSKISGIPLHGRVGDRRRSIVINISDMLRELSKELAALRED